MMARRKHELIGIDGEKLARQYKRLLKGDLDAGKQKSTVLFKAAYERASKEIRRRVEKEAMGGVAAAKAASAIMDELIRRLSDFAFSLLSPGDKKQQPSPRFALVATGGYGRGMLAPYSDIDILFLLPAKNADQTREISAFILYALFDSGLKVGYASRTLVECIKLSKKDLTIRTAFLESRCIWGDEGLYRETKKKFQKDIVAKTGPRFVEEKMAERDQRHERMGNSRYVVEPNLKDGKGGLRDLQTLYWIGRYLYGAELAADLVDEGVLDREEYEIYRKAARFLWTVRVHLHLIAGRAEERLTFDVQPELAKRLHYKDHPGLSGVERFMKHYFLVAKQIGDLTRTFCACLEARHQKRRFFTLPRIARRSVAGFKLDGGRLRAPDENVFKKDPAKLLKIFAVADEHGYDIHPDALRLITKNLSRIDAKLRRDPEANGYFMAVLASKHDPENYLRRMNEAGVFGRFVTDFGRVVAQMQYDMYHHYTVDEHTIRAIGLIAKIEKGELEEDHPLSTTVIHKVISREVLYLAVLLHDIAKGRGGDHSEIGEKIAHKLGPRLGLTPSETETTAWLVRHHLLMSRFAFKRDLSDPKTVADFVATVKSPERLRLLLILTVVDIRAVGPGVWNAWKGQLLRDLYYAAEEIMVAGHLEFGREKRVLVRKAALKAQLKNWKRKEFEAYVSRLPDAYWIAEDEETHIHNAHLVRATGKSLESAGLSVQVNEVFQTLRLTAYLADRPGLFADITGAIALSGFSIVDAKIFTTEDDMALDNFTLQSASDYALDEPERILHLKETVRATLTGKIKPHEGLAKRKTILKKRSQVFRVEPQVLIDNRASRRFTVIEVNARDRPGLLHDLSRAFYRLKVSLSSAHAATYGERAVDVLYVQNRDGTKITHPLRIRNVKQKLMLAAVGRPEGNPAKDSRKPALANG